jgi:hypothetical protein
VAETFGLECPAQPGNVPLHQVHGIPGRHLTPDGIDHLLSADRPTRLQRQHGQDHPLLDRSEIYNGFGSPDPKRSQDAESQSGGVQIIHVPPPGHWDFTLSKPRKGLHRYFLKLRMDRADTHFFVGSQR